MESIYHIIHLRSIFQAWLVGKSTTPGQIDIRVENAFQFFGSSHPIWSMLQVKVKVILTDFEEENTCASISLTLGNLRSTVVLQKTKTETKTDLEEEDAGAP
jgi:hypothetical protein